MGPLAGPRLGILRAMPRCETCKHAGDRHIEASPMDDDRFPCIEKGCRCRDYEPELEARLN